MCAPQELNQHSGPTDNEMCSPETRNATFVAAETRWMALAATLPGSCGKQGRLIVRCETNRAELRGFHQWVVSMGSPEFRSIRLVESSGIYNPKLQT